MPAKSRVLVQDDVFNMTYDKLRKELKKKRLSAAGKKSDLQFRLVEFLNSQKEEQRNIINEEPEEEENDEERVGEPMETEEAETPTNRTFTVEESTDESMGVSIRDKTPTNSVGLVLDEDTKREMCASLGIDLQNFEVKSRTRVHRVSGRKSLREAETSSLQNEKVEEETIENRESTPVRQREPAHSRDRFAIIHAKEMEKEETLGERRERMQKRHDDLTANVPDSIKRLATPKSVRKRELLDKSATRLGENNWAVQNPENMTFKFGTSDVNDFSEVANARSKVEECLTPSTKKTVKNSLSRARAHVDVKQLSRIAGSSRAPATPTRSARKVIPATLAEDDTFTDYISTPKGSTPNRVPKRGGYTPHTSKKVFVDTTQLTDREYILAAEEGLIPGKPATKSSLETRQLETKKRRDDIIALKRKMNIK
uniref:SAP domain-containing protein n=1 Tax=Caenorhabditis tropicalis TaxID=1561998 RepID=A0A1I7TDP5_9PELO